jgi:hypothetical protein
MLIALLAGVGLSALIGTARPWSLSAAAAPVSAGQDGHDGNRDFARRVTGTWLGRIGDEFQLLRNINEDGTMVWSNNFEYRNPDGAVFGVWTQTGKREMTSRQLGYLYDSDGVHFATGRVTEVTTFDDDYQTFASEGTEEVFYPDQDPTDPDEEPFFTFTFALSGSRLAPPEGGPGGGK